MVKILTLVALLFVFVGCKNESTTTDTKQEIVVPPVSEINTVSLINEAKSLGIEMRDHTVMTDEGKIALYKAVQEAK